MGEASNYLSSLAKVIKNSCVYISFIAIQKRAILKYRWRLFKNITRNHRKLILLEKPKVNSPTQKAYVAHYYKFKMLKYTNQLKLLSKSRVAETNICHELRVGLELTKIFTRWIGYSFHVWQRYRITWNIYFVNHSFHNGKEKSKRIIKILRAVILEECKLNWITLNIFLEKSKILTFHRHIKVIWRIYSAYSTFVKASVCVFQC